MSKTLLNRLAMFEVLDTLGPLTISELAEHSGSDIAVVSRTVAACEPDGWISRIGGRVAIGPRFTLLGHVGPAADLMATAAPLVHAMAGVTGLLSQAYALIGSESVLVATAAGRTPSGPAGLATKAPLHATAPGRAIAAQLASERLDAVLPEEPYPDAETLIAGLMGTSAELIFIPPAVAAPEYARTALARSRLELTSQLDTIRADGYALDVGSLDPAIHCIAVPWSSSVLPAALACLGPAEAIETSAALIRRVLAAAGRHGATAATVIAAATT
jgi:DNA-binding IclR family transcriptional regulator